MDGTGSPEARQVRSMFGRIARRYDLLNHVLSANLDRSWRRAAARKLCGEPLERVLDLCGGTGDLTLALARALPGCTIVCCDFAHPMLVLAQDKFEQRRVEGRCVTLEGDGLRLPFAPGSFDAVTVAFGVRNLADMDAGLREMRRVLRPRGRLVVLEFTRPAGGVLARLYEFYLKRVLPRIGDAISGSGEGAYRYLARSIAGFSDPATLERRIREAGFSACEWTRLGGGIVALHTARVAAEV